LSETNYSVPSTISSVWGPDPTIRLIAEDKRGAAWSLKLPNGREAVLIYTKKGYYRGGHSHTVPEVSMLLTGSIHYKKRFNSDDGHVQEAEFNETAGETLYNDAGEPHLAHFLEDSWLLDWKLSDGPVVTSNYPPYRKFVDEQLS
jgi:hypothetical protein